MPPLSGDDMAYPTTDSASATIEAQNTFTDPVVMDYEGHVLESKDAGTNVLVFCNLHFN